MKVLNTTICSWVGVNASLLSTYIISPENLFTVGFIILVIVKLLSFSPKYSSPIEGIEPFVDIAKSLLSSA